MIEKKKKAKKKTATVKSKSTQSTSAKSLTAKSGSANSSKKSLTAQPKMKVKLQDTCQEEFARSTKGKVYDESLTIERKKTNAGRSMSKRIAGFMSARTRKDQVARDRITGSKAK